MIDDNLRITWKIKLMNICILDVNNHICLWPLLHPLLQSIMFFPNPKFIIVLLTAFTCSLSPIPLPDLLIRGRIFILYWETSWGKREKHSKCPSLEYMMKQVRWWTRHLIRKTEATLIGGGGGKIGPSIEAGGGKKVQRHRILWRISQVK